MPETLLLLLIALAAVASLLALVVAGTNVVLLAVVWRALSAANAAAALSAAAGSPIAGAVTATVGDVRFADAPNDPAPASAQVDQGTPPTGLYPPLSDAGATGSRKKSRCGFCERTRARARAAVGHIFS